MALSKTERLQLELLIVRLQRGDESAFAPLVAQWERPLLYYLRRIAPTEDDAWDALQETWLRALRGLPKLRQPGAFPAWIYRIARNAAFAQQRGQIIHDTLPEESDRAGPAAEEPDFSPAEAQELHWAIGRLDLLHREPIVLHFLDDLSIADIAGLLAIPEGTVKSRIHTAKRKLRHILQEERAK
ncbi:MAG: sigma-70 family RNA polymerase sigma factor [Sumerlaeia bacterium]